MNTNTLMGLALMRLQSAGSKVLLIRSASASAAAHWALPTTERGEALEALIEAIKADLMPSARIVQMAEQVKAFAIKAGELSVSFATTDAQVLPYFESDRFVDARWASFDEAFHIAHLDHEGAIRWGERQALKLTDHKFTTNHQLAVLPAVKFFRNTLEPPKGTITPL